jgi:hypothetical protein
MVIDEKFLNKQIKGLQTQKDQLMAQLNGLETAIQIMTLLKQQLREPEESEKKDEGEN